MSQAPVESLPGGELKPFLAHLEDLRRVLIRCALAVLAGMAIAAPLTPRILALLKAPLHGLVPDPDAFLLSIDVAGAFSSAVRIALWSGLLLAAPVLLLIIGAYLLPVLTARERKYLHGVSLAGVLLFAGGVWLGYRFTLGFALSAMLSVNQWLGVQAQWTLSSYVTFVSQLLIAFGIAFEIPVLLLILGRMGIISSAWLRHYRRHAVLGALIVGAVLTPPDMVSQIILAGPLIILYEVCIWIVWSWERAASRSLASAPTTGTLP